MKAQGDPALKKLNLESPLKLFAVIFVLAVIAGVITGSQLAKNSSKSSNSPLVSSSSSSASPTTATADNQTFKDFAEGVIQNKPQSQDDDYSEGAYLLVRQGQDPVALTSSVVDLSQYVGKKVKVFGETQKALKAGWLMDVGKVQVE